MEQKKRFLVKFTVITGEYETGSYTFLTCPYEKPFAPVLSDFFRNFYGDNSGTHDFDGDFWDYGGVIVKEISFHLCNDSEWEILHRLF